MSASSTPHILSTGPATEVAAFFAARGPVRTAFLHRYLPAGGVPALIREDWGTRRYYRIHDTARSYILMEAVPAHLPFATLGHRMADFLTVAAGLAGAGLHTPAVIAAQPDDGYILMEDMGDVRFWDALAAGTDQTLLYETAVDVLDHLGGAFPDNVLKLHRYHDSYIHAARRRLVDWYVPALHQRLNPDGLAEEFLAIWDGIEKNLPPAPMGVVHGDYHLQNLMWMPDKAGIARCGLLDFQDAMWGPLPYDMANLLDDIRRDVPADLRTVMIARRTAGLSAADKEAFMAWYPVLALQFHCRIIGQVIRLALVQGKTAHLNNMPRIQAHVKRGLEYPAMRPLKSFMADNAITFDTPPPVDAQTLTGFIRPDAF